jgi:hypothetical protein
MLERDRFMLTLLKEPRWPAMGRMPKQAQISEVFWFFSSEKNIPS